MDADEQARAKAILDKVPSLEELGIVEDRGGPENQIPSDSEVAPEDVQVGEMGCFPYQEYRPLI